MSNINTTAGTRVFIGTPTEPGSGSPPFEYEDDTYIEILEVESFGEFGDEATLVTFLSVKDGRVRKLKGSRNAGAMALVCGRDPLDAGQLALKAAQLTKFAHNFKVILADARDEDHTESVQYFRGLVMTARDNLGGNDDVTKTMFTIEIDSAIDEEPSVESP